MSQLTSPQKVSDTQFFIFSLFCLLLILKKVFEKLALYSRRGVNTPLVSDWLKAFL